MQVELVRAWPRRFDAVRLSLAPGSTVANALDVADWRGDDETVAYAIFGVRVKADHVLQPGDRVELLRPLLADPKDARRRRAAPG